MRITSLDTIVRKASVVADNGEVVPHVESIDLDTLMYEAAPPGGDRVRSRAAALVLGDPTALHRASAAPSAPASSLRDALRTAALAILQAAELVDGNVTLAEPMNPVTREGRATLARLGYVQPGHYNGLGTITTIAPGATGVLQDYLNRNCWARTLHLRTVKPAEVANKVVVTSVTHAGMPVNIGNLGAPIAQFENFDLERDGNENLVFLFVGQSFQVHLRNDSDQSVHVSGGFDADELTYFGMGALLENTLRRSLSLLGDGVARR